MNEDGKLFYTAVKRVAIRISDAAVTNDVSVIFQPSSPLLHPSAFLPAHSSFAALPGSRFTGRGSEAGDEEARKEK
jgi:hypothetical protein